MKLGTAVTILNEAYKPINQWSDTLEKPSDLPENETVQEAWSTIAELRRKHTKKYHTGRVYHSKNFDKVFPRKDEIIADIKNGSKLWELNKKYGVSNFYPLFERLGIKWIYQRYSFLRKCIFAIKDDEILYFSNVENTCRYFKINDNYFNKWYIVGGEPLKGYKLYRYNKFMKVYPEYERIFEEIIEENNL